MRSLLFKASAGLLVTVLFLSLGGCNKNVTKQKVWKDMSPELETLSLTKDEHKTRRKRAKDTTLRQIHDDADFLLLEDRPLYLSEYPIP